MVREISNDFWLYVWTCSEICNAAHHVIKAGPVYRVCCNSLRELWQHVPVWCCDAEAWVCCLHESENLVDRETSLVQDFVIRKCPVF